MISRIVVKLDNYSNTSNSLSPLHAAHREDNIPSHSEIRANDNRLLNEALMNAIYAYSARWLPLRSAIQDSAGSDATDAKRVEQDVRDHLWRRARTSMFSAMSRPSYRAVLALLLVSLTEMPLDNDDQGFNDLCSRMVLSHLNFLQSVHESPGLRPLARHTMVLPLSALGITYPVSSQITDLDAEKRQHMQDTIFWLGVMNDTRMSLMWQSPSLLLPCEFGDRKVWNFIRQRTVIFDNSFRTLHGSQIPLDPRVVTILLQHASACKTMYLSVINRFCDALFHHNVSDTVEEAAQRIIDESARFHDVFDDLLSICARDYLTMPKRSQLNYVLLMAHYHLGSLILADILDKIEAVPESLRNPFLSRHYACQGVVNALSLILQLDRHSDPDSVYSSLFLLDPVPELMVEVLSRTGSAIFLLHDKGLVAPSPAQTMLSVVMTVLSILSQISVTASLVLLSMTQRNVEHKLKIRDDYLYTPISSNAEMSWALSTCDRHFVDEFLQEMKIQASVDGSILERTIRKYEDTAEIRDTLRQHQPSRCT
ncbi:uncharacterized protein Z518_07528 [Rhinocladiella mackenziei CBS 650.93]|uniref:Transcription factor domain-containing protein n=1 Tax=Rhinocladiella mackenziei CBS 650.93 TaxID=1442369 RepID=A0A0D2J4Q6_9EURO|nr:uncharacterized protein Z518_07528 [Rhinocladiella mackenziei CBS 650.93]KIX03975.1 hypothetical protein Z518_07528 [Rhinocladiella mackenziei CBS 650.93]